VAGRHPVAVGSDLQPMVGSLPAKNRSDQM
jgi:hypothetical protein